MSGVSAGRLLMLICNVMFPASSFATTTLVMSGAAASSPVESGKVVVLLEPRAEPPSAAVGRATRTATSAIQISSLVLTDR